MRKLNQHNKNQGGDWDGEDENMDIGNSGADDTQESGEKGGRAQTDIGSNFEEDEDLARGSQRSGRRNT